MTCRCLLDISRCAGEYWYLFCGVFRYAKRARYGSSKKDLWGQTRDRYLLRIRRERRDVRKFFSMARMTATADVFLEGPSSM